MSANGFYRALEDRFYAPRSTIKELRKQYLPFVEPLSIAYAGCATFDIGCGRGEWLELMLDLGFRPFGVDLDEGMLQDCVELGLPAELGDAVAYLSNLPDESQAIVTAFHVVEHVTQEQLVSVVVEAHRVLKPGGLLIMETPNPENIVVATTNFYLDPTHVRPLPPPLLSFLTEHYGFARTQVVRLQEDESLRDCDEICLRDVLGGVSPDYAVVAQKSAESNLIRRFDAAFAAHHGVSLEDLAGRYDAHVRSLARRLTSAEEHARTTSKTLNEILARCEGAERAAQATEKRQQDLTQSIVRLTAQRNQLQDRVKLLEKSWSWRLTAPLRGLLRVLVHPLGSLRGGANRAVLRGVATLQGPLAGGMVIVFRYPRLRALVNRWVMRFPALYQQLHEIAVRRGVYFDASDNDGESIERSQAVNLLNPRAEEIYRELVAAIENRKELR